MLRDIGKILYDRSVIEERVKELAAQVASVYRDRPFLLAVTLKGAFIFAADLIRHLPENVEVVFVRAASYGNATTSTGTPRVELPSDVVWRARDVLLVEDIVDTGRTLQALVESIRAQGAWSVRVCTFLDKPTRREVKVDVEFVGFTLPDDTFVVGYGLDFDERFRQLPFVGTLKLPPTS